MNKIKNIISGSLVKTGLPLLLGGTGVVAGSVAVLRANDYSEVKQEFLKSQSKYNTILEKINRIDSNVWNNQILAKGLNKIHREDLEKLNKKVDEYQNFILKQNQINDENHRNREITNDLNYSSLLNNQEKFEKALTSLEEKITPLRTQISTILDTKISSDDLTPITQKIESVLEKMEKGHSELFTEVNDNYEAVMDTIDHINKENFAKHKEIISALRAQKTPVLDTKILEQQISKLQANLYNWNVSNAQQNYKYVSDIMKKIDERFDFVEREIWGLGDDVGLWAEDIKEDNIRDRELEKQNITLYCDLLGDILNSLTPSE